MSKYGVILDNVNNNISVHFNDKLQVVKMENDIEMDISKLFQIANIEFTPNYEFFNHENQVEESFQNNMVKY